MWAWLSGGSDAPLNNCRGAPGAPPSACSSEIRSVPFVNSSLQSKCLFVVGFQRAHLGLRQRHLVLQRARTSVQYFESAPSQEQEALDVLVVDELPSNIVHLTVLVPAVDVGNKRNLREGP